jgi:hypothetical protein
MAVAFCLLCGMHLEADHHLCPGRYCSPNPAGASVDRQCNLIVETTQWEREFS